MDGHYEHIPLVTMIAHTIECGTANFQFSYLSSRRQRSAEYENRDSTTGGLEAWTNVANYVSTYHGRLLITLARFNLSDECNVTNAA